MKNNALFIKKINEYSEEIIGIVNDMDSDGFKNAFLDDKKENKKDKKLAKSQLSTILNSIKSANSVEEIKLFIKYQETRIKGWKQIVENETLANLIIGKIDEVTRLAEEIKSNNSEFDLREIKLGLVEKFLGYLYWKGTIYAKGGK